MTWDWRTILLIAASFLLAIGSTLALVGAYWFARQEERMEKSERKLWGDWS